MHWRIGILIGLAAAAIVATLFVPRVPQDPEYHQFIDQSAVAGIPNFFNVISNLAFLLAGAYGLLVWRRSRWREPADRWTWLVVVLASLLICIGSGYYHWSPDNRTLFWDRLPMTLGFMGILSAVIAEHIHSRIGVLLLAPFLVLGMLSVEVWRRGELTGVGDLRFYALVQFYPMVALPLILLLFAPRYSHPAGFWQMIFLYGTAKVLELADRPIYQFTGFISGHSLKHFAAAGALVCVFRMLSMRKPL